MILDRISTDTEGPTVGLVGRIVFWRPGPADLSIGNSMPIGHPVPRIEAGNTMLTANQMDEFLAECVDRLGGFSLLPGARVYFVPETNGQMWVEIAKAVNAGAVSLRSFEGLRRPDLHVASAPLDDPADITRVLASLSKTLDDLLPSLRADAERDRRSLSVRSQRAITLLSRMNDLFTQLDAARAKLESTRLEAESLLAGITLTKDQP